MTKRKKMLQPAKSKAVVRDRKPRHAVDRSVEEWEIRIWKKGVPEPTTLLAKVLAYAAEPYWGFFKFVQQRAFLKLSTFTMERWESFYRNPALVSTGVWRSCSRSLGVLRPMVIGCRIFFRPWDRMTAQERMEWLLSGLRSEENVLEEAKSLLQAFRLQFQAELRMPMPDDPEDDRIIQTPEVQFFTTVWLPSMLLLEASPAELFRRAEQGDAGAICDLIRLDPFAVDLPAISRIRHEWLRNHREEELTAVRAAQTDSIAVPSRQGAFKIGAASALIGFSKTWCEISGNDNACLDRRDMWNLFDLVARERGRGNDSEDLPSFEAFQRAVSRHKLGLAIEGWDIFLR